MKLFDALLRRLIRQGRLVVTDATGLRHVYGDAALDAQVVAIRFTDRATPQRAAFNPALALGEAMMDGGCILII